MSAAVLYRWQIKPGREDDFRAAWTEGTKLIHKTCASYGARLHRASDGQFWSYARWPDEAARKACFDSHDFFSMDCFKTMQDCIETRFDEVVLTLTDDELAERGKTHPVPELETGRLILRAMRPEDAGPLFPALSDAANMHYWSSGPLESVDAVRDYLSWNIHGEGVQCFVFAPKSDPDDALGWVILMDRKPGTAELGYMQRPDAHGKGFAREAAARVIRHGFETRGFRRIWADADIDNAASIRLLEALGFEREGHLRGEWETHIGVRDSLIFGLMRP
ncbi:GNAT family N-acetyltransferase [Hyphobacterium marinum]|uniref:GNAT family N-acetyltransferase n=1 Tax=Hyphobacterium marinum TaxID=3116574 RepID=A0ABU7LUQ6_9PROT|nr:GNAT family N-acetyltransferase [Hyphobacterium sp. Y6023]MEE2565293.1 GNAT family N-acetyltransferase [Hyphobacterium sp. Y6023]